LGIAFDDQSNFYILTELYPKNSLRDFLKNNKGRISLEVKLKILFEVARALNYMHTLEPPIIHRDIKPLNVFIDANFNAKIGDFGLAKEVSKEELSSINTDTVSTLEYMSPETLDNGLYRLESDIYSFGVLLYEVLSEKNYIEKEGFQVIQAIVIKKYRPSLETLQQNTKMKNLIEACWHDDWKARPNFSFICEQLIQIISESIK
jgi:serine/threonine protein kinase